MYWKWYADKYFILQLILFAVLFLLNCLVGSTISIFNYQYFSEEDKILFWDLIYNYRLPKTLTAILTGIALSCSGWILQEFFRNPLAGPSVLGITSFAGLGVAISIVLASYLGISFWLNEPYVIIISALFGALMAMAIILTFSLKTKSISAMILIGIMLSGMAGALISLLQFYADMQDLKSLIIWSFGSISGLTYTQLFYYFISVFIGVFLILINIKSLQKLQIGHGYAHTMGVNIHKIQIVVILSSSIMTAAATALVGPIVFIGIAIPHMVRISLKSANFIKVLMYVIIVGAITIMLFTFISENIPNHIMPINIISALIGAPILIWVVYNNRNKML